MQRYIRVAAVMLCLVGQAAWAHETTENRARFVLQEDNHLRESLFLSYSQFLYQAVSPREPFRDFLLKTSAMADAQFEQRVRSAHQLLARETQITIAGRPANVSGWVFPEPAVARARVRQLIAATLAGTHVHEEPLEIGFDVRWPTAMRDVRVRFPAALQTVTVVSYRPHQVDVARRALSPVLGF